MPKTKKLKWEKLVESYYSDNKKINFRIKDRHGYFELCKRYSGNWKLVHDFPKISSAKKAAQLIYNG